MANPYNFFGGAPSPQALAAAMMPTDSSASAFGQSPQAATSQMPDLGSLYAMSQKSPDSYGLGSQAWDYLTNQAPGNPLGLSSGSKISPDDLLRLKGAFGG